MTANISRQSVPSIGPAIATGPFTTWSTALRFVKAAWAVARERNALAGLDDRMLKDIGVTRCDAEREFMRDFLDIPLRRYPKR